MKDLLKNIGKMQVELGALLKTLKAEGSAGGGMVKIVMDGEQNIISVRLEPEIVKADDIEMLQDLIRAAANDAQNKIRSLVREEIAKKTGLPFGMPV